jgi:hypothetical protein
MNDRERFATAMNVLSAAFDKEIDEATGSVSNQRKR